jgi:hypothetical protein
LPLTSGLLCRERRQREAQEPNTPGDRKDRLEQRVAEIFEFAAAGPDLRLAGAAARDLPKVRELDLERDGAAASPGALAMLPDLVNDILKRRPRIGAGMPASLSLESKTLGAPFAPSTAGQIARLISSIRPARRKDPFEPPPPSSSRRSIPSSRFRISSANPGSSSCSPAKM